MTQARSDERLAEIAADPSTHFWVKRLLVELQGKDPVDVANVLNALYEIFDQRCRELLEANGIQLSGEDIVRRLVDVDRENDVLSNRVSAETYGALYDFLEGLSLKVSQSTTSPKLKEIGLAMSAFTIGHDYHRAFGDLPHA